MKIIRNGEQITIQEGEIPPNKERMVLYGLKAFGFLLGEYQEVTPSEFADMIEKHVGAADAPRIVDVFRALQ